ncbi:DUF935 domain-containing protein [Desulfovibrio sp. JC010]|uniref:DUF935 domain-containing protein n=1 Tax=Desulfovibrio sp. JC010 TaxID=2593641 RepID=UPI0013D1C1DB|nr:DUF935 domain-containing protein [Desulfovibrio sp. JC010]NDV27726.1 DUF935 domain-containing protein [Desulfovibrio sp. JC010]
MVTILDQYGQPIKKEELTKEIAAPSLTGVRNVWQGAVTGGLTPARLASIIRSAQEGDILDYLTLAEEMEERDLHYRSVLSTRKLALAGLEPTIEAANEDDKKAVEINEAVRELIESPSFNMLLFDLADGLAKGFSVAEIDWETRSDKWVPRGYVWRDPRFFCFDKVSGNQLRMLDDADPVNGVELPPYKFIVFKPRLKSGIPIRGGLAMLAAWAFVFKSFTLKDWMAFIEVFGMPVRLGKYGPSASDKDIETLIRAVANIGTDAAAVIPESMVMEFVEIASKGGEKVFEGKARFLDEQVSKGILGQTMTADSGSSEAQSRVHDEVRQDILTADARQAEACVQQGLIIPYVDLNYGPQEHYPRFRLPVLDEEDVSALVDNVVKLVPHGLTVSIAEIRSKLGLREPKDNEPVICISSSEVPQVSTEETAANRAMNRQQVDELDALRDEGLNEWEPVMAPVVDPIRDALAEAESYEEALERLEAVEMDSSELMRSLTKQAFKARGLGNADG